MKTPLIVLAAALWAAPGLAADGGPRKITVKEALEIVNQSHPSLRAARSRMEAAAANAHSQRGRLLPSIHLKDSQSWYNTAIDKKSTLLGPNIAVLAAFPDDVSMNMFTVAAEQPLLGLLRLSQSYAASDDTADASVQDMKASEADIRANVRIWYLRLFEAKALADTADSSVKDLEEQVQMAKKKMDAGALTTADVLRLQVAAASAKQQVIAARGQAVSIKAQLLETLGLAGSDTPIEFVEPTELQEMPAPPDLKQAREQALKLRPELASMQLQARSASHRAWSKTWALLPDINVQGSWMHVNLATFDAKKDGYLNVNAANVGLSASWAVWEWGAQWYEREEAECNADAAAAQVDGAVAQVGAEVASRHSDMVSAASAVDVALTQVASAEEAYRVMQALSSAGSATTTDLLDAEAALTSARLSMVRARYEAAIAAVSLNRATGIE